MNAPTISDTERYALIKLHEIMRDARGDSAALAEVRRQCAAVIDQAAADLATHVGQSAVDALLDEIYEGVFS